MTRSFARGLSATAELLVIMAAVRNLEISEIIIYFTRYELVREWQP